jgi:integrase
MRKLPYIPTETEIDQIIASSNSKYASYFQFLKESSWRPSEPLTLTPTDLDLERGIATLNKPEKGSKPRQFKMSDKLITMMKPIVLKRKLNEPIWKFKEKRVRNYLGRLRTKLALKLGNPKLLRISPYTFRHWKATMTYHKTKDILYVMNMLGHKNIRNTLVYTQLVNFESDEYTCKVANSIDEAVKFLESGFEYVTDYQDKKIFRKRK